MPLLFPVHAPSRKPSESPSPTPSPSPSPSPVLKALSHTPLSPARDGRFSLARGGPLPDLYPVGHGMAPLSAPGLKHTLNRPPTLHIPMSSWRASSYALPEKRLPRRIEWANRLPALFRLKSGIEAAEGQGIAAALLEADAAPHRQPSEEDRQLSVSMTPKSTVAPQAGKALPGSQQHQYLTPVSPDPAGRLLAPIRPREPDTSYRYTPKRMAEDDLGVLRAQKRMTPWL